jgi:hypothetical protein
MKKNFFALFVSVWSLTMSLSGSAQVVINTYAEASMAQSSLMLGLDSTAYLSINYADKDSCEIFRLSDGGFTSIFKHVGQSAIADFNVFSEDTLYGPVGEHLYAIALSGGGHKVLSDNFDIPLLLSEGKLFIAAGEAVGGTYLQHLLMRDVTTTALDTVVSYGSSGIPFVQHLGVVDDNLYFSIARYPEEKSTVLKYGLLSGILDTLTTEGTISFGVGFGDKFAYSTDNGNETVEVTLVSSNTTATINLDRREYSDFLLLSEGPNGEFLVNTQESLFIWDGVGDIESWNYGYEPTSTNWKGRYISSSYDEELVKMTYSVYVGDAQYQLFQLNSLDLQFVVSKDNKLYIRRPINDWTETQIIMYDLCPEVLSVSSASDQTYFSAKEIQISGLVNVTVPSVFEAQTLNILSGAQFNLGHPEIRVNLGIGYCPN